MSEYTQKPGRPRFPAVRLPSAGMTFKLTAMVTCSVLITCLAVGVPGYFSAGKHLEKEASQRLDALATARANAIATYLGSIREDVTALAISANASDAALMFASSWESLDGKPVEVLQKAYIAGNPHPPEKRHLLDTADDETEYSDVHRQNHKFFRRLVAERGYHDICIFDPAGNLIYSVFKKDDFATNMKTGKWKDTGLAEAFRKAAETPKQGALHFVDFRPYAPSAGAPAGFISAPMINARKELMGVIAIQMPIDRLNAIMDDYAGLGETGEAVIVGADFLARNDTRHNGDAILKRRIESEPVRRALAGESGVAHAGTASGGKILAAFLPLTFEGTTYALVMGVDRNEVLAPTLDMRNEMILIGLVAVGVLAVLAFVAARGFTTPIVRMTGAMEALADGDKTVDVPGRSRGDEIGKIAAAVQHFKDKLIENERLQAERIETERKSAVAEQEAEASRRAADERAEAERRELEAESERQRRRELLALAESFEQGVGSVIDALHGSAVNLQEAAGTMNDAVQDASEKTAAVAAASDQASANVQTVASAAEELSASVQEIGRQVTESARIAAAAAEEAERTNGEVKGLADAASRIGEVIGLINDIASQTNLLALNATIEAARAGSRRGIRRRRHRGQEPRRPDRPGDRGNLAADRRDPGGDERRRRGDRGDQRHDRQHQRHLVVDRVRRRTAGRVNQRDRAERPARGGGNAGSLEQYRLGRRRDGQDRHVRGPRGHRLAEAVRSGPDAAGRSRPHPGEDPRCLVSADQKDFVPGIAAIAAAATCRSCSPVPEPTPTPPMQ